MNRRDELATERYRQLVRSIFEMTAINPLETKEEQRLRITRAKSDFEFFVYTYFKHYAKWPLANFHIELAYKIRRNKRCKLLLGWGRGLAKSTLVDLLIPLWLWINDDIKVMVLIGENADKAAILLSDIQAEFEANQMLIHDFGAQRSLGMGQSVRGLRHRQHRPDYAVPDDLDTKMVCKNPKRVREYANWLCEDLMGALDSNASRYIQVNNIFAPLTILTQVRDTRTGFEYIRQDAEDADGKINWKGNESLPEFYATQKEAMGLLSFNAEYNNSPYTQGVIFTEEMIQWGKVPRIDHYDSLVGFWDVAYSESKTADYNAVKLWGVKDGVFYQIKAFVRQCRMRDAMIWVNDYMNALPEYITINWYFESQFWNEALMMVNREVNRMYERPVNFIKSKKPEGAKYDRMLNMLPFYQQGKIIYNINEKKNPDMQTGIAQLMSIEPGYKSHDDSPDADAEALKLLSTRTRQSAGIYRAGKVENRKF
jgi:phage terminase large subunit-like protein